MLVLPGRALATLATALLLSAAPGRAGGPMGLDGGVVVSGSTVNLSPALAARYVAAKTGWVRVNMILPSGHSTWDNTALGYYDTAINNARAAGLQILILMNNQGWTGGQSSWNASNYETTGGTGDNAYVDAWVGGVATPILQHFHDRVKVYEIWNEPSTWASSTTNNGVISYSGSSYMYPSCYCWLLSKSWLAAHQTLGYNDVKIISGGVFGTSALGASDPGGNSGSNYVSAVYSLGTNTAIGAPFAAAKTTYGTYPVDGIGQHLYIDYNINTTSTHVQQYLGLIRGAYTKFEGTGTPKKTYVTEFGWTTASVSQQIQGNNLSTAFGVFEAGVSYVPMAIWFNWQDSSAANLYFGILDVNGNPKTAYSDYQFYEEYEGYYTNGTIETNIQNYFNAQGQPVYGDAFDNGASAFVHNLSSGTYAATAQDFSGGSRGNTTLFDTPGGAGTLELNDLHGLWTYYNAQGGFARFGSPQNNEYSTGTGTRQDFAAGFLAWTAASGIVTNLPFLALPFAAAEPVAQIADGDATLNGMVTANTTNATGWFEWGTNDSYGNHTAPAKFSGFQVSPFSAVISGLAPHLIYHFRVDASNAAGTVFGSDHLFSTGSHVKVWGADAMGLGYTNLPAGLTNVTALAAGAYHALALSANATVTAWGYNGYGQTNVPGNLTNAVQLAAGYYHSLALRADGSVAAWGGNNFGQTNLPAGLTNVAAVAAGGYHSLALKADGTTVAWGDNIYGETNAPAGLANVIAIAGGLFHSLALRADGSVVAWGANSYGQTNVPAAATNIVGIAAGNYHNLALRADGTLLAWGDNVNGQTNVPVGATNILTAAAGGNFSLALRRDGQVLIWGDNSAGQTNFPGGLANIAGLHGGLSFGLASANQLPQANAATISGFVNHDVPLALSATAGDGASLSYRITTLPASGVLYQAAGGRRGDPLDSFHMNVTNVTAGVGYLIFAPATNAIGNPCAAFNFVANDGLNDSAAGTLTVDIVLPPAPRFVNASWAGGIGTGNFQLTFAGVANATYSVLASTNLFDWFWLGSTAEVSPGTYQFVDPSSAGDGPNRFYRLSAP